MNTKKESKTLSKQNTPSVDQLALTEAFSSFTQVIDKFQATYDALQNKIDILTKQIEVKNYELEKRISEGENIKTFLNSVLENIYTGVLAIDLAGNITVFNRAAEQITGYEKDQVLGQSYLKHFSTLQKKDTKSAIFTLTTGKESHHRQKVIMTQEGIEKNIEFSTTILRDTQFNNSGVVETFTDISEVKKLQERMSHIETLAALGEMSASVAHEIRNPLGGIGGFAGLLDRQLDKDDHRRKLIKPIIEGVSRLNNIVSNLLTYTRPQKMQLAKVDLNFTLNEIVDFFKVGLTNQTKVINIKTNYCDERADIFLDVQLFQQVMINILKNACDAIPENGNIEIRTILNIPMIMNDVLDEDEKEELLKLFSYAEIEIKDDGKGIPDDVLPKLFNPFFTTKDDGNGLGLAICKKIIQLHRGDIHVSSQQDVGTTFTITLPVFENYE